MTVYIPVFIEMKSNNYGDFKIFSRVINIISFVFPPVLPIFFTLNQTIAIIRLNWKKIIGLYPDKLV